MIFFLAWQLRNEPIKVGRERLPGLFGTVRVKLSPVGIVQLESEQWTARRIDSEEPLGVGEKVQVVGLDGLKLLVKKVD